MDNVAEWICEVDRGHLYPYKGNYSTYLETKAKRMEIQGAKDAKLAKRLKSELEWVRSSRFRPARVWVPPCWKPSISTRRSATACSSTT